MKSTNSKLMKKDKNMFIVLVLIKCVTLTNLIMDNCTIPFSEMRCFLTKPYLLKSYFTEKVGTLRLI